MASAAHHLKTRASVSTEGVDAAKGKGPELRSAAQQGVGAAPLGTHPPVVMRHTLLAEVWLHQLRCNMGRTQGQQHQCQAGCEAQRLSAQEHNMVLEHGGSAQQGWSEHPECVQPQHPPGVPFEGSLPGPEHLADHHRDGYRQGNLW